jgi:chlorobactene glucosyltransferase
MTWVILSTIAFFVSLAVAFWVHNQHQLDIQVRPAAPPAGVLPRISVIVPARNEERNIAACLAALQAQSYPNLEVIVVDDHSSDRTPQILAAIAQPDARVQVITGRPLSAGWAGKPHALWQGAQVASGEWLCFIDADTFARPSLIASAYTAALAHQADLLTLMTDQHMETFWEKTLLPLIFTALSVGFSPRRVNDPRRQDAIANGQFLFFHRPAYQAIGGHQAVAGSIVEDRDLARRVKSAGLRLVVADGRAVAATRMYTRFSEIWEGWTKNIYLGLSDNPRLAWLGIVGALLCFLGALGLPGWVLAGLAWLQAGGGTMAALVVLQAVTAVLYLLYWRLMAARGMRIAPGYALTFPLGALVFGAMMVNSAYKVLSGRGVTWKGRRYLSKGL